MRSERRQSERVRHRRDARLTFHQLRMRSRRLAQALARLGIQPATELTWNLSCTMSALTSIALAALMYAGHMSMAMASTPARCSGLNVDSTRWASSSLRPGVTSHTRDRSTSVTTLA